MTGFKKDKEDPESGKILEEIVDFCSRSETNILLNGGSATLPEILGGPRTREINNSLDFLAKREGMKTLIDEGIVSTEYLVPGSGGYAYLFDRNGMLVSVCYEEILGCKIPKDAFNEAVRRETDAGVVYVVRNEMNLALKLLRNIVSGPHGKDALDAAAFMTKSDQKFEPDVFSSYIVRHFARDYDVNDILEPFLLFGNAKKNLSKEETKTYLTTLYECASRIEETKSQLNREIREREVNYFLENKTYELTDRRRLQTYAHAAMQPA